MRCILNHPKSRLFNYCCKTRIGQQVDLKPFQFKTYTHSNLIKKNEEMKKNSANLINSGLTSSKSNPQSIDFFKITLFVQIVRKC